MAGRLRILVCLGVSGLVLLAAAPALASGGTSTSAGDQQYVDPLANTTPSNSNSSSPPASSSPSASSSSAPSSSAPPASSGQASAPAPTSSTHSDPSGTLPFTGLNVGLLVAIGLGLVAAGLLLRRVVRRT